MQWKIGFAIIHCTFSLHSASRGEEETDLQEALRFPTTSEHAIFGWCCSVTQTLKHIHAERLRKLAKSQSSKSTWHGAAPHRAGLAAWLQTWDTHVGLALPLAGSLNSQLQAGIASAGPEQAPPKLRDAVAEQTLLNPSAPAPQPLATTFIFTLSRLKKMSTSYAVPDVLLSVIKWI